MRLKKMMKKNMKTKLALTMFTLILLSGCEQPTKVGDEVETDIVEVEYDGHNYIVFGNIGVQHDPECKCLNKRS